MLRLGRGLACVVVVAAGVAAGGAGVADAALSPGDLDPSFGAGGTAVLDPALAVPRRSSASDMAVDAQGRIVVAGDASDENGKYAAFVGRLQPNGALDTSFAQGWRSVFQLGVGGTGAFRPYSMASDVLALGDGKVGMVPYRIVNESNSDASMMRLRSDGQRDGDFGSNGIGSHAAPAAPGAQNANAGVGNDDGSVYLGGLYDPDTNVGGAMAAWWKLDNFGQAAQIGGSIRQTLQASQAPNVTDRRTSIAEMLRIPGGKTLVVGSATWTDTRGAGVIARLNPNGTLDGSFGATLAGATVVQARDPAGPGAGDSHFSSVAVGSDGLIYAAGTADDAAGRQAVSITRFGPGGIVDTSFGSQGTRRIQLSSGAGDDDRSSGSRVVVQPDGRPVIVAGVEEGAETYSAVVRLQTNGALDPSFGSNGVRRIPVPAGYVRFAGADAAITPEGRLTVSGGLVNASTSTAAVVRMTLVPVADPPPAPPAPPAGVPVPDPVPSLVVPDRVKPRVTNLKVTFDSKRVPLVRFTASKAARFTVLVERVRKGRKRSGKCVVGARRGTRCTTYTKVKSTTKSLGGGAQTYRGAAAALVASATYRITVTATDAAGNTSTAVRATATVPRPARKRKR